MINGMRHVSIYDPETYKDKRVAIIGVGTIGSHLALTLARMGVALTLYDHDTIEEHNLATQSYGAADIGKLKVNAVKDQIEAMGVLTCEVVPNQFTSDSDDQRSFIKETYAMVVSCVDSIDARREIASHLPDSIPVHDGRVGAEQVEIYRYASAQEWYDALPETADVDPCGARFTAYTANIAAGLLANNVKRELLGQVVQSRILYDAASSTFIKT